MAATHDEPQTRTLSRRLLLAGMVGAGGSIALRENAFAYLGPTGRPLFRASVDALQNVEWPGQWGQSDLHVYFERTGHTLKGLLLDYWRATGGVSILGAPISEPFALGGYYSQAFERGVLQYQPEYVGSETPIVRSATIGALLANRVDPVASSEARRPHGGGDRQTTVWAPLDPAGKTVAQAVDGGGVFFDVTGHTLNEPFLSWYRSNSGAFYLGAPISEAALEGGALKQYFECGALIAGSEGVRLAKLPRDIVSSLGIDIQPQPKADLPEFDEWLFQKDDNPNPIDRIDGPGRKFLEASISEQVLYVWRGETLVSTTYVSTGLAPNYTEKGLFTIRLKTPKQDMKGFTNESGEVVGGSEGDPGLKPYDVKDVPNVQYFNNEAEALHGAYWHNNFGSPMSHGCVNLPLGFASFLYGWATLGTQFWVHE